MGIEDGTLPGGSRQGRGTPMGLGASLSSIALISRQTGGLASVTL